MSMAVPTNCANPECREPAIKPIHRSSQSVAIDAVDGAPVFAHYVTYRCSQCGHTWAVQGYSLENTAWQSNGDGAAARDDTKSSRGW